MQQGENENLPLHGGVPKDADFSRQGVNLHVSDLGPHPAAALFLNEGARKMIMLRRKRRSNLLDAWRFSVAAALEAQAREAEMEEQYMLDPQAVGAAAVEKQERENQVKAKKAGERQTKRWKKEEEREAETRRRREPKAEEAMQRETRLAELQAKRAAAEEQRQQNERYRDIAARVRRTRIWCNCGCIRHRDNCRIRSAVSGAELEWSLASGGSLRGKAL